MARNFNGVHRLTRKMEQRRKNYLSRGFQQGRLPSRFAKKSAQKGQDQSRKVGGGGKGGKGGGGGRGGSTGRGGKGRGRGGASGRGGGRGGRVQITKKTFLKKGTSFQDKPRSAKEGAARKVHFGAARPLTHEELAKYPPPPTDLSILERIDDLAVAERGGVKLAVRVERSLDASVERLLELQGTQGVLQIEGIYYDPKEGRVMTVMEFIIGSLRDVFKASSPVDEAWIVNVLGQILIGLRSLHESKKVHLNLTLDSVFSGRSQLDGQWFYRIGSMAALSNLDGEKADKSHSDFHFMAPEVANGAAKDGRSDLWSLGIIALELANGASPFAGWNRETVLRILTSTTLAPKLESPTLWSVEFQHFVSKCLERDLALRPTADDLLAHPVFKTSPTVVSSSDHARVAKEVKGMDE